MKAALAEVSGLLRDNAARRGEHNGAPADPEDYRQVTPEPFCWATRNAMSGRGIATTACKISAWIEAR
jgi:hypothetical protein